MDEQLPPLAQTVLAGIVRHVLTALFALLASHGVSDASLTQQALGASGMIAMAGWSWFQKWSHSEQHAVIVAALERRLKAKLGVQ